MRFNLKLCANLLEFIFGKRIAFVLSIWVEVLENLTSRFRSTHFA